MVLICTEGTRIQIVVNLILCQLISYCLSRNVDLLNSLPALNHGRLSERNSLIQTKITEIKFFVCV